MNVDAMIERKPENSFGRFQTHSPARPVGIDPMALDQADDELVVTTGRRLKRLATVACDTGARFARENLSGDAAEWMSKPRMLFDGACAMDACQTRDGFLRATLLHGLSLGLDADPIHLDAFLVDDGRFEDDVPEVVPAAEADPGAKLFTGTVEGACGVGALHLRAFFAMIAPDEAAARRRLRVRYGQRLGDAAMIQSGFDAGGALARSLLSPGLAAMVRNAAADPSGDLAAGLDVHVAQRSAL